MFKKCIANCYAGLDKNLYLRGKIFYYMIELPRVDGKRRYYIKSLHTTNYYEAREKVKDMEKNVDKRQINQTFTKLRLLLRQLVYKQNSHSVGFNVACSISAPADIKVYGDINIVNAILEIRDTLKDIKAALLTLEQKQTLDVLNRIAPKIEVFASNQNKIVPEEQYTIDDIIDSVLKEKELSKVVENKKRKMIEKMVVWADLKTTDKYSQFYKAEVIKKICEKVRNLDVTSSVKRNYTREIKNLILKANELDPDLYKINLIGTITKFDKTKNSQRKPHWPFTESELKQIFSTTNDYFKSNPDVFWTTLIGLFVGARCNAAITLQYGDIIKESEIDCLNFQDNDPIKQLKNDASIRKVPIPKQLLDMGFVDWVNRQKKKLKAKDKDQIFPKCKTSSGEYNNKYTTRGFIKYIKDIGIPKANPDKRLDFHSLRKNANKQYEKLGVPPTFINKIIGWEGKDTREKHYSDKDITELKPYTDKMNYDFLQSEFNYWAKIMRGL